MPPSTTNCEAVMNEASSLARNATAAAISSGSAKRPIGTCTSRLAARSGSLAKSSMSSGVATGPGQSALIRMPSRANCTPSSRVMASTPPLLAVYAICDVAAPSSATNDAVLMIEPLPCRCMCGIAYLQQRNTLVVFTLSTRSQASRPVIRIESSSGGEMPALLNAMSTRPYRSATPSNKARTDASSLTSHAQNSPPTSAAAAFPASSAMSTQTSRAPSAANRRTVASPIPLPAPVTTATRPSSLCTRPSSLIMGLASPKTDISAYQPHDRRGSAVRDEDGFGFRERLGGVWAQLAAQAGLLHAAERGPVPHRGVAVHAERPGLHGPGHPQRPAEIAGPDAPGEAILRVVGQADRLGLVAERQDGQDRAEDFLAPVPVARRAGQQHGRREPPAGAGRGRAGERDVGPAHVRRHTLPLPGGDERSHLRGRQGRILDPERLDRRLEQRQETVVRG